MRRSRALPAIALIFLFLRSLPSYADLSAMEIVLDGYQSTTLSQDMPISDAVFQNDTHLWMAGKNNLWRWSLSENRLHKVPIKSLAPNAQIKAITVHNSQIFAATDRALYRLEFSPVKLARYDFPNYKSGTSITLSSSGKFLWWIHQNGIFKIGEDLKLKAEHLGSIAASNDRVWLDTKNRQVWFIHNENLFMRDLRLKDPNSKLVHHADHSLIGLSGTQNDVFVLTPFTVLKFDQSLRLTQAIPVEGNRKLLAANFGLDKHTYLFDDKLLEIFDMRKETVQRTHLDFGSGKIPKKLWQAGDYIAILVDNMIQAFSLSSAHVDVATKPKKPSKG